MEIRRCAGPVLLVVTAMFLAGCSHGSGVELGTFGSSLDSDDLGEGYGGGVKLELNPIDLVSVDGRAGYLRFSDHDVDMFPLEVAGLLNTSALGERIVAYAGAGVGCYFFESSDVDLDDSVGFFPLVGLEIGLHRVSLLAEARWLFLEADVDSAKDELRHITDADVDGLGINIGLLFRL